MLPEEKQNKWFGYRHSGGSIIVKRAFSPSCLKDADHSPYVRKRTEAFTAENQHEALMIAKQLLTCT